MNLNMIRPKNQTEDILPSITKNCETLIERSHRKAEETLEFKMIKPKEIFHFNQPIQVKDWMLGLTDLEVYNSIFNKTAENKKFKLYNFPDEKDGGFSYEKIRDEIERDLLISDITAVGLQDDIIGPFVIKEYREQVTKRMKDDKYMDILAMYVNSIFQDLECFLRTQTDLVEDDIRFVLDESNSSFINYELEPGIYTIEDLSNTLHNILQPENDEYSNTIDFEYDDISMKTKMIVVSNILAVRSDEKLVSSVLLQDGTINTIIKTLVRKL